MHEGVLAVPRRQFGRRMGRASQTQATSIGRGGQSNVATIRQSYDDDYTATAGGRASLDTVIIQVLLPRSRQFFASTRVSGALYGASPLLRQFRRLLEV